MSTDTNAVATLTQRIIDLEKELAGEKRLREAAETKYNELRILVGPLLRSIDKMADPVGKINEVLEQMKQDGVSVTPGE